MSKMASSPFGVEIERGLGTQREGTGIVLAAQHGRKRVISLGLPGQHYVYLMETFVPCLQESI